MPCLAGISAKRNMRSAAESSVIISTNQVQRTTYEYTWYLSIYVPIYLYFLFYKIMKYSSCEFA